MWNGEIGPSESILVVEGIFDVRAAKRVVEYLEATGGRGPVRVDLTKVTDFHDFGVALLAQALKEMTLVRARVVGLRTHQVRLLRYFGLETDRVPQA